MRRVAPMPAGLIAGLLWAGIARHNPLMSRILLIDDDEHLAAPLATYFARFDCVLDSATRPSDGLVLDLDRREVLRQGERVELTGTEFELLALLARQPGKVWSRDDILNQLRGQEADFYTRAVDIVVSRLRKKLEPLDCIKTLRNAGYALAVGK